MIYPSENLLAPLMVVSIGGAGLTLAGGNFLRDCVRQYIENKILKLPYEDILPLDQLLFPLTSIILATVLLFLFSGLSLIGYIILDFKIAIYISYYLSYIAALLFSSSIILYLLEPIFLYMKFKEWSRRR